MMDFEGHQLIKIDDTWVFDLTTFIGYSVNLNTDKTVKSYTKKYIAVRDSATDIITFNRDVDIPAFVLKSTVEIIRKYIKEALLDGRDRDIKQNELRENANSVC